MKKIDILLEELRKDVYCRLKKSKISGVGVFAIRNIPKGVCAFKLVNEDEFIRVNKNILNDEKIHPNVKKLINEMYVIEGNYLYLNKNGLNGINISFFVNHSENPNLKIGKNDSFFTLREIKEGEELTVNYNTYADNTDEF